MTSRPHRGPGTLPRLALLAVLLMVLLQPGAAAAAEASGGPVLEVLRLAVPAGQQQAWLRAERQSWEPWLRRQPGFEGRQELWDPQRQQGVLLIRWASRRQWHAITDVDLEPMQKRFEAAARQLTGTADGNPFPLLSSEELEVL